MTHPVYNSPWPRVRLAMLERDHYLCQLKGPKCKKIATEVDHIIDWRNGGAWYEPANLRSVCRPCHNWRKSQTILVVSSAESSPSRIW